MMTVLEVALVESVFNRAGIPSDSNSYSPEYAGSWDHMGRGRIGVAEPMEWRLCPAASSLVAFETPPLTERDLGREDTVDTVAFPLDPIFTLVGTANCQYEHLKWAFGGGSALQNALFMLRLCRIEFFQEGVVWR
jgi:hypothetical protein